MSDTEPRYHQHVTLYMKSGNQIEITLKDFEFSRSSIASKISWANIEGRTGLAHLDMSSVEAITVKPVRAGECRPETA